MALHLPKYSKLIEGTDSETKICSNSTSKLTQKNKIKNTNKQKIPNRNKKNRITVSSNRIRKNQSGVDSVSLSCSFWGII